MSANKGKPFEEQFKRDWLTSMGETTCDRIYDVTSGRSRISNICDFICYKYPRIYYMECKEVAKGNTFNLAKLTQYDKLVEKNHIKGVVSGVVIWFREKQKVVFVPISTFIKLKIDGAKSYSVKYLDTNEYYAINVPSVLKRVFMTSDYSVLLGYDELEEQS